MRCVRAWLFGLALSCLFLEGCGAGAPRGLTPEQTVRADAKSQGAMRQYYGNMIGKKAGKPEARRK